jgi:hypothetical protein
MTLQRLSLCSLVVAGLVPALAAGTETETREFRVLIGDKDAGTYRMTIQHDQGTYTVSSEAKIRHRVIFVNYRYDYSGIEVWKDGQLQSLESNTNDDGKRFTVSARREGNALRITTNGKQRTMLGDVWTTCFWRLVAPPQRNHTVALLDADTGKELSAFLRPMGEKPARVAGTVQNYPYYELKGSGQAIELWYDAHDRLVRKEWIEDGYRVVLELKQVGQ